MTVATSGPSITSPSAAPFTRGSEGSFNVTDDGLPHPTLSYTGTLPDGLHFDTDSGVISGTPTVNGEFHLTLHVSNSGGTASQDLSILCEDVPHITSDSHPHFSTDGDNDFGVQSGDPTGTTYTETGRLPDGVSFDNNNGDFHGTPTHDSRGEYDINVTAHNDSGSDSQDLHLRVDAPVSGCTLYWTGASSSAWSTSGNWSLTNGGASAGRTPTTTDTLCFSTAPTTSNVTLSSAATVTGIQWPINGSVTPHLTINAGASLNVTSNANAAISNLTDNGTVTVGLHTSLAIDTLTTGGVPVFVGPGTVSLNVGGTGTLGGTWPTLRGGVDFVNHGTLSLPANAVVYLSQLSILDNEGTFTVGAGSDLCDVDRTGSYFLNGASANFNVNAPVHNATIHVPVTNNGNFNITAGGLTLFQATLNNGNFNIGDHTLSANGTFTSTSSSNNNITFDNGGTGLLTLSSGAHLGGHTNVTVANTFNFSGSSTTVTAVSTHGAVNTSSVVVTGAAHQSSTNNSNGTTVTITGGGDH